ncbi:MAG: phage tail assembly protein T [Planctomycetota bacterium]|jgi:hypothetical protein
MLANMPMRLFFWWMTYYGVDPWGEERADLRSGMQMAQIGNALRSRGAPTVKPADFMPYLQKRRQDSWTPEAREAALMAWARAHNRARAKRNG